jgi:UDP-3-O-[3-hydroxymyristoyl] glucosamine N-acyltransferase
VKLARIAQALGCSLPPGVPDLDIARLASPEDADGASLVFLADPRQSEAVQRCPAPAVIVKAGVQMPGKTLLEVPDAYLGYAQAAWLFEDRSPLFDGLVHATAFVHPDARLHASVRLGPHSVVGRNVVIGEETIVGAGCIIENHAVVGSHCRIDSGAVVRRQCVLGNRVIVQANAVIGSEGFGNARRADGSWLRIPCFGAVVIEDDVEVGAGATIDRGNFTPTVLRRGCRIDNLVQVAHNVEIGENTAVAAQAGFAGSTRVGKNVLIGGQAGFNGHIEVGDKGFIAAQAGVTKSTAVGARMCGAPARDLKEFWRIEAALTELPALVKEVRELRKRIDELEARHG